MNTIRAKLFDATYEGIDYLGEYYYGKTTSTASKACITCMSTIRKRLMGIVSKGIDFLNEYHYDKTVEYCQGEHKLPRQVLLGQACCALPMRV